MGKRVDDVAVIDWCGYMGREAVFPVCMKSPAVNGRPLSAQLSAAKQRVENLVLVICDSLDRHNAMNIANAADHCIAQGDVWLEANINAIKDFFPKVEVLRWEKDIRSHAAFDGHLKDVRDLYRNSPAVKELRDAMSLYYLGSKKRRFEADWKRGVATNFNWQQALQSSSDYLDEEFAGDMVYHKLTGGIPHIYWGLYVDDHNIFSRESGKNLAFPETLPVTSLRHGPSLAASALKYDELLKSNGINADSEKALVL
jgi:hypothetical protein